MSGSIACYKICYLVSHLSQNNFNVKVVMSTSAQKFIGPATLEALSHNPVYTDTFESGHAMEHIYLDRWADLILLAPATANTINKLGHGFGDDLISTLFLAHDFKKPFLIAPAMNTQMYLHPTTQESILKLKKMNIEILESASGILACGEIGYGKLLDQELLYIEIVNKFENLKTNNDPKINSEINFKIDYLNQIILTKKHTVLITAGGTQEPIDDVRYIGNHSTGRTAATIADQFINAGFDVTYLSAVNAIKPHFECRLESFVTYNDLDQKLTDLLKADFKTIIHVAAVSDYSLESPITGKISSLNQSIQLNLIKNPKIINKIKKLSSSSNLIGFKLTSTENLNQIKSKVNQLFTDADCDYVVHNDYSSVHTEKHLFNLYTKNKIQYNLSVFDLSHILIDQLIKKDNP